MRIQFSNLNKAVDAEAEDLISARDREKCYANLYSVFFLPLTSRPELSGLAEGTAQNKNELLF